MEVIVPSSSSGAPGMSLNRIPIFVWGRRSLPSWSSSRCPRSCFRAPCCYSTAQAERNFSIPQWVATYSSISISSGGLAIPRSTSSSFREQRSFRRSSRPSAAATLRLSGPGAVTGCDRVSRLRPLGPSYVRDRHSPDRRKLLYRRQHDDRDS